MRLTQHFSLEEMSVTQVRGVDNTPPSVLWETLRSTAKGMEEVRDLLGQPVLITSGYRSPEVNKVVGGAKNSAHLTGHAADFICPAFGSPKQVAQAIAASDIKFDQLIWEDETWVHISFDPRFRQQVLTKRRGVAGYQKGIVA